MQKHKNPTKFVKDINQPVEIKSSSLRVLFLIIFLIWCAIVIGTYTSRSNFSNLIENSLSVIRMDKSNPVLSEIYETDTVIKSPISTSEQISSGVLDTWRDYSISILLLILILIINFSIGHTILRILKLPFYNLLETVIFSISLGYGILAYIILLLGALSLLYQIVIYGIITILGLYSIIYLYTKREFLRQTSLNLSIPRKSTFDKFLIFILILFFLINLIGVLAPETFYDTIYNYFAIPQYYLTHHGIHNMPYNIHSHMIGMVHMLYALGLALTQNETLPKLINFSMSLLVCLSLYSFSARYFSKRWGVLSVAVFYTIPLVTMETWRAQVEIGLSLFVFLSLYTFINWYNEKNEKINWLLLSAIFVGFSVSIKYIGFLALFSILILIISQIVKNRKKLKLSTLIFLMFISFAIESPWLIKNCLFKSNPLYPYFTNIFTTSKYQLDKIEVLKQEIKQSKIGSLKDWLLLPWNLTLKPGTESPLNGPIFLCFLPLVLLFLILKDSNSIFNNFLFFFVVYYSMWSLLTQLSRYLIPALPVLSIVITYVFFKSPINIRKFLPFLFILITLLNVSNTLTRLITLNGWRVVIGLMSYEDYLSSKNMTYNAPSYRAISFINNNLPGDAKILFWGETRAFPCRRDFIASSDYVNCPFDDWARESKSGKELYEKLQQQKITHILWNVQETQRLHVPEVFFLQESDEELKSKLTDFSTKHLREIFSTKWTRLFEIN